MVGFLERYLDSVETLPTELHRNLTRMRELDIENEAHNKELEETCAAFLSDIQAMNPKERAERLAKIQGDFRSMLDIGDAKVSLAVKTYDTVDQHIRQLDSELSRFEAESAGEPSSPKSQKRGRDAPGGHRKRMRKDTASEADTVEDMPVDPNEPTYCLCHQVSYGEMIACDAPDCATEWFHFACVNLKEKPKTKWYCPRCRLEMDRKR